MRCLQNLVSFGDEVVGLDPSMQANDIIFVDDAHTFGGAQIALSHGIRALSDCSNARITFVGTAHTIGAIQPILGDACRVRFVECPSALPLNIFTFPARLFQTIRLLRDLRPDPCSSTWIFNLSGIEFCLASLVTLRLRGVKVNAWLHNPESFKTFTRREGLLKRATSSVRDFIADKFVFRQYAHLMMPSGETGNQLILRAPSGMPPISVLYPTLTGTHTPPPASEAKPELDLWLIGRIDYGHKNNGLALKVLKYLIEHGYPATLSVVGDGPDYDLLLRQANEFGVIGSIRTLGWMENPWRTIAEHSIVLIPSHWESFGLVVMEAVLRNLRVVLSPIAAFKEIYPPEVISTDLTPQHFAERVLSVQRIDKVTLHEIYADSIRRSQPQSFVEKLAQTIEETSMTTPTAPK